MAGPWEKYQAPAGGSGKPWEKFKAGDSGGAPAGQRMDGNQVVPANPMAAPSEADIAPPPYSPSSVPVLDAVNAFGTSLAENIPFVGSTLADLGNRVDAGFASMVEGKPVTPEERAQITEAEQQQFPVASVSGAVAGNVLPMAPLAATRAGQVAFGLTGSGAQRLALGGASGSAMAFGDALTDGESLDDAINTGIMGGAFGAAGGYAAPYIEDGLQALQRLIAPNRGDAATGLSRPANEALIRAMQSADALGENGAAAIRAGGPTGMLADAGGAGLLDTAIQRGGPGAIQARQAIEARAAAAGADIDGALTRALGAPRGVKATETGLRQGTAAQRDAAYKAAYAQPINYASDDGRMVEELLVRVPSGVIQYANRLMQLEGEQSAQIMARIADDGSVTFLRMPDVRQIDYITRALNTAAKSGEGQGALGGQTDIGRAYANLARDLRDVTRVAVPEYDAALSTAARPIQAREALQYGEKLLSPTIARDEARETIEAMTRPQLEMVRQGVRSYIDDTLANVRAVASDPNIDARQAKAALAQLSSPAAREKIRMILETPAEANRLFAQLAQASRALELRASVANNSRTAGRLFADEAIKATQTGPADALMRGQPLNAGRRVIQDFFGTTPQADMMLSDRTYAELARALTMQGDDAIGLLSGLQRRAENPRAIAPWAPGVAQGGNEQINPPSIVRLGR